MSLTPDVVDLRNFAIALAIGALVGIEREKRKTRETASSAPGIRTFIMLALIGATAGWITQQFKTPWILAASVLGAAAMIVAGYLIQSRRSPEAQGLTTEMAELVVCLLGALSAMGHIGLAAAVGVAVSAVLAYKQPIHGLVEKIGTHDLYAGLKLLIASCIVLPVLPDRTIDPWGAINPQKMWWLVILISGLSLVGYVATRLLGPRRGTALTGLTGGLVSSTAATLSLASRSRREDLANGAASALVAGLLLAWFVMFIRVVVEVAIVNPPMVRRVLAPLCVMGLTTLAAAGWSHLRGSRQAPRVEPPLPVKNPFSLTAAMKFALLFAAVLLVVRLVQHHMPGQGLLLVAALAGLTDVDAITLSMADYARTSGQEAIATRAVLVAVLANTLAKCGMVVVLGARPLRRWTAAATAAIVVVGAIWLAVA